MSRLLSRGTDFEQVFVAYVSTHLPKYLLLTFLAHSLIRTQEKTVTPTILHRKIKPIVLII